MSTFSSLHSFNVLLTDYAEELFRMQDGTPEVRLKLLQVYAMQARVAGGLRAWLVHVPDAGLATSVDPNVEQMLGVLRQRIVGLKSRGPGAPEIATRGGGDLFNDMQKAFSILGPPGGFPDDDPAPAPAPSRTR